MIVSGIVRSICAVRIFKMVITKKMLDDKLDEIKRKRHAAHDTYEHGYLDGQENIIISLRKGKRYSCDTAQRKCKSCGLIFHMNRDELEADALFQYDAYICDNCRGGKKCR